MHKYVRMYEDKITVCVINSTYILIGSIFGVVGCVGSGGGSSRFTTAGC